MRTLAVATAAAVVATFGVAAIAGPAAAAPVATSDTGLWIVRLAEPSLAAHQAPSGTVDVSTSAARAYIDRLAERQAAVADLISNRLERPVEVKRSYRNVLNAIVIEAEAAEAAGLAAVPGVVAVEPDVEYELTTDTSHDLIGSAAIWGGDTGQDAATRGEGVVVGILDSGINPFHPSFAATDGEGYTHTNPYSGSLGVCAAGHPDHDPICNSKLVGAYSFVSQRSARDANGHGSHTASTAAGNRHEVTLRYGADTFTRTVQGVASRAIAAQADRRVHVRDRHSHQADQRAANDTPWFPGGSDYPRCRTGTRSDLRRRDRRRDSLRPSAAAVLLGRDDPQASRVRHEGPPRPDHQAGQPAGAVGRGRSRANPAGGPARARPGAYRRTTRCQHRQGRRRSQTPHAGLLRAARRPYPLPDRPRVSTKSRRSQARGRSLSDPHHGVVDPS